MKNIKEILFSSIKYIEGKKYKGYDAWDGLNTERFSKIYNKKIFRLFFFHLHGNSPINFRKSLGVKKSINAKGLALMIEVYCNLYELTKDYKYIKKSENLLKYLLKIRNREYSGLSWGYPFPWETLHRTLRRNSSNVVTTAFVARSLIRLYKFTNNKAILRLVKHIAKFVNENLFVSKTEIGSCISYTPVDRYRVLNASLLGAEILAYSFQYFKDKGYENKALECVKYALNNQHSNGSWSYAMSHKTGFKMDKGSYGQVDWHQGYVLDSLINIKTALNINNKKLDKSINDGLEFYKNEQFKKNGLALWRWPRVWPVDIHNQSQGIVTLIKFAPYSTDCVKKAKLILRWTLDNLFSNSEYKFYYRKYPFFKIRINYMRWSQMWMAKAISDFVVFNERKN